ncbi:MAG: SPOR domain-containing protein [Flavobacteriales bacterium]
MSKIDKHIEELLHSHDCVIVPDFGGFITSKQSAYYNKFTSVFHPATKKTLFNKHLVFNDGLLAAKVAEKQELSIEEATQLLIQFKDDCYLKLNEDGRVEVEKVGVLFFDKEKNIQFRQSSTNFLNESFGLSQLKIEKTPEKALLKTAIQLEEVERVTVVKKDRKPEKVVITTASKEPRKKRRVANLVPLLMVPVLAGCFFVMNKHNAFDQKNLNLATLNPFSQNSVTYYQPRENKIDLSVLDTITIIKKELVQTPLADNIVVENSVAYNKELIDSTYVEPKKIINNGEYHLIIGCFSVKDNAEKLVQKWSDKGYESKIVDKKGRLYRVSVQSFNSRKEAKETLSKIKSTYFKSIWVLKK